MRRLQHIGGRGGFKAEEEIRLLNESLEQKVTDRTQELREAQARDRVNLQRLVAMIAHLPMAAVVIDENETIIHANELLVKYFNLSTSSGEMVGRSIVDFAQAAEETIVNVAEFLQGSTLAEKTLLLNQEIHLKDGRILLRDTIPIVEQHRYHGQLLLFRDVTLEYRADVVKSEFMSLASHQLRTPLTTIRWSMGRLIREMWGQMNEFEQRLMLEAKRASARMSNTIDTMLTISRIESGKVNPKVAPVHVERAISEVWYQYHEEYKRKRQHFFLECDPKLIIYTDQAVLKEILQNLLSNAIHYTAKEGIIRVSVSPGEATVRIDVKDTGYGIPAHQQEKIFSKFFRGDNIVQKDTEGTGLGLYLVSLLTKILGGTITFISEEGQGTTFSLVLPLGFPSSLAFSTAEVTDDE